MKKNNYIKIVLSLLILMTVWQRAYTQVSIPPDKEVLLKSMPSGDTLIAVRNGFSSPQTMLAWKVQLGLTKVQIRKINELLENLSISASVKGQEIIEAEENLDKLFVSGTINEKTMRAKLENIGKLRAELRFTYLQIYLKAKQILTANQQERIKELQSREGK
jgi:Spy/CpxP family protein refolding chaperone